MTKNQLLHLSKKWKTRRHLQQSIKLDHLKRLQPKKNILHQRGTILISTLLITALAAILAAEMMSHQSKLLIQSQWVRNAQMAQHAVQEAKQRTILKIYQKLNQSSDHYLHRLPTSEDLPKTINQIPVTVTLQDGQTKWNLNALSNLNNPANTKKEAILLLQTAEQNASPSSQTNANQSLDQIKKIVSSIQNYVLIFLGNDQDNDYLKRYPPSYPSHQMLTHISQLRSIIGISKQRYRTFSKSLTALPTTLNLINLNDLNQSNQTVLSVFNIPSKDIDSWRQCVQKNGQITNRSMLKASISECPLANINSNDFLQQYAPDNSLHSSTAQLSDHSNYIFVTIRANIKGQTAGLNTLLFVGTTKDQRAVIKELWEDADLDV